MYSGVDAASVPGSRAWGGSAAKAGGVSRHPRESACLGASCGETHAGCPVGAIGRNCMCREGLGGHPDQDPSRAEGKSGQGTGRGAGKHSATEAKDAVRPKDGLR